MKASEMRDIADKVAETRIANTVKSNLEGIFLQIKYAAGNGAGSVYFKEQVPLYAIKALLKQLKDLGYQVTVEEPNSHNLNFRNLIINW